MSEFRVRQSQPGKLVVFFLLHPPSTYPLGRNRESAALGLLVSFFWGSEIGRFGLAFLNKLEKNILLFPCRIRFFFKVLFCLF